MALNLAVIPFAVICLSAVGLVGCQSATVPMVSAEPASVRDVASVDGIRGGVTTLRAGQTLSIALPANPTTGYSWSLAGFDEGVLRRAMPFDAHVTDSHAPGMVGVGGVTRWTFEAAAPGETTLTLSYGRPWAKDASDETAIYRVVVR